MKKFLPIFLFGALALLVATTTSCENDPEEIKEYSITVTASEGGSAEATVDGKNVVKAPEGVTVTLTATPEDGYNFIGWTVENGNKTLANPTTLVMPAADLVVRAEFEEGIINVFNKIEDPGFKYYCDLMEFDTDKDGVLTVEEARAVPEINVSEWYKSPYGQRIETLAGIEYFTSITSLKCYGNLIAELDLSKNTELVELNVATNMLETLDLTHNTKLKSLSFGRNRLTTVDLTPCPDLEILAFYESPEITSMDLSHNSKLREVDARMSPKLKSLNFSNNPKLEVLYCHQCSLTKLDISNCPELKTLYSFQNQLTTLDVSSSTKLEFLSCEQNQLTSLDVSNNTALTTLYCWANRMKTLDASSMANPNDYTLGCGVQTRDGSVAQPLTLTLREDQKPYWEVYMTIWQDMNANVTLAGGAPDVLAATIDPAFRTYCEQFDTDQDGRLSTAEAAAVTEISVPNMGIKTLAGINYFTGLKKLICNNNEIATLSVIDNEQLTDLVCNDNGMTALQLTYGHGGEYLVNVDCQNNKLTKLLAACPRLEKLNCQNNELQEITFTGAKALKSVNCMNNKLENIWFMEKSTELQMFTCSNNLLEELNLSNKPKLMSVMCNNCRLTSLNLSGCTALMGVMAFENRLATLDASMMQSSFNLFCGKQTTDGTTPLTLTLTLREDQLSHWNEMMKDSDLNANVVLAE